MRVQSIKMSTANSRQKINNKQQQNNSQPHFGMFSKDLVEACTNLIKTPNACCYPLQCLRDFGKIVQKAFLIKDLDCRLVQFSSENINTAPINPWITIKTQIVKASTGEPIEGSEHEIHYVKQLTDVLGEQVKKMDTTWDFNEWLKNAPKRAEKIKTQNAETQQAQIQSAMQKIVSGLPDNEDAKTLYNPGWFVNLRANIATIKQEALSNVDKEAENIETKTRQEAVSLGGKAAENLETLANDAEMELAAARTRVKAEASSKVETLLRLIEEDVYYTNKMEVPAWLKSVQSDLRDIKRSKGEEFKVIIEELKTRIQPKVSSREANVQEVVSLLEEAEVKIAQKQQEMTSQIQEKTLEALKNEIPKITSSEDLNKLCLPEKFDCVEQEITRIERETANNEKMEISAVIEELTSRNTEPLKGTTIDELKEEIMKYARQN